MDERSEWKLDLLRVGLRNMCLNDWMIWLMRRYWSIVQLHQDGLPSVLYTCPPHDIFNLMQWYRSIECIVPSFDVLQMSSSRCPAAEAVIFHSPKASSTETIESVKCPGPDFLK